MQVRRTLTLDLARSVPHGVIMTAGTTFTILIANKVFQAPDWAKAMLLAASPVGMLLGFFSVAFVRRSGWTINRVLFLFCLIESLAFVLAASSGWGTEAPRLTPYVAGMFTAFLSMALSVPLLTQIYRKQYPTEKRGQLFSFSAMLRAGASILAAVFLGKYLDADLQRFDELILLYAGSALVMAFCALGMGTTRLPEMRRAKLFEAFSHVSTDKPFLKLLGSWMILGFGNLFAFALFVEALTNPIYGYSYDTDDSTFITTLIPQVAFILCVFHWGRLFDKWNFYFLRTCINLVFIAGVVIYYCVGGWWGLVIGIALHGIARSGGNVAWSLWTTKFATPDRVADYMSIHTFCTGIRGTIAPFIAFALASRLSLPVAGAISAGLMGIATLMILPDVRLAQAKRKSEMLEVPKD